MADLPAEPVSAWSAAILKGDEMVGLAHTMVGAGEASVVYVDPDSGVTAKVLVTITDPEPEVSWKPKMGWWVTEDHHPDKPMLVTDTSSLDHNMVVMIMPNGGYLYHADASILHEAEEPDHVTAWVRILAEALRAAQAEDDKERAMWDELTTPADPEMWTPQPGQWAHQTGCGDDWHGLIVHVDRWTTQVVFPGGSDWEGPNDLLEEGHEPADKEFRPWVRVLADALQAQNEPPKMGESSPHPCVGITAPNGEKVVAVETTTGRFGSFMNLITEPEPVEPLSAADYVRTPNARIQMGLMTGTVRLSVASAPVVVWDNPEGWPADQRKAVSAPDFLTIYADDLTPEPWTPAAQTKGATPPGVDGNPAREFVEGDWVRSDSIDHPSVAPYSYIIIGEGGFGNATDTGRLAGPGSAWRFDPDPSARTATDWWNQQQADHLNGKTQPS